MCFAAPFPGDEVDFCDLFWEAVPDPRCCNSRICFPRFFSCALVLCPAFLKWWCRDLWDDLRPKCTHYLQCFESSHAPRLVTSLFLFLLLKGLLLFVLITWFVCWETLHLCGGNASLLQQQLCWLSKNNRLECFQRPADGTALLSY